MDDLSGLRKTIYDTDKKRAALIQKLLRTKPFIAAQVYERFKTCGNENCRCKQGIPHGPFLWLYQKKKGNPILSTTIAKDKETQAKELAERYKLLLAQRQTLREFDQEINVYLNSMEKILELEANGYVTNRDPGRPKKNR